MSLGTEPYTGPRGKVQKGTSRWNWGTCRVWTFCGSDVFWSPSWFCPGVSEPACTVEPERGFSFMANEIAGTANTLRATRTVRTVRRCFSARFNMTLSSLVGITVVVVAVG